MTDEHCFHPPGCVACTACGLGIPVVEKFKALLTRIAEIDGPIECSSLQDWQRKVKAMAANALKGIK